MTRRHRCRPVPVGRSTSSSGTSVGAIGGLRRSSPTVASKPLTPATCATASRRTIPTPPSTGCNDGAQLVIDAVDHVGSDARVWTFLGPRPAGWWIRRRRARSRRCIAPTPRWHWVWITSYRPNWPPMASANGSSASPSRPSRIRRRSTSGRRCICTRPTTGLVTGEWTITNDEEGVSWSHAHGKGTAAVRGPAKDLLLAIVRRRTAADAGIEVFGDGAVWDGWLDRTPF